MQTTTAISEQTKTDLTSILETLDQRIHEIGIRNESDPVSIHEQVTLGLLRDATLGALTAP